MPDNVQLTPIQSAWISFIKSVQSLLVLQVDDRPLDQYLPFRDDVLALVQNEQFLRELNKAWESLKDRRGSNPEIFNTLLIEIKAFPLALEVAKATEKSEEKPEEPKKWWKRMLGRASTVTGSIDDLVSLTGYAKDALTLFRELIDIFKGEG